MITTVKELDETDKKIIEHLIAGFNYKQIASKIFISVPSIKYRIKAMKNQFNCTTLASLIHKVSE